MSGRVLVTGAAGDQLRHFTYAGDLARGIVTAMEHPAALEVIAWVADAMAAGLL